MLSVKLELDHSSNLPSMRFLIIGLLLASLAVLTTGCLNNGELSAIQFNNQFVEIINSASAAVKESTDVYDQQIPNIVTEDSTVDVAPLETSLTEAQTQMTAAETLATLQSKDESQQDAVQSEFATFLALGKTYLESYTAMIAYYKGWEYKENLDKVATLDLDLHNQYNDFIASHNKLVDILAGFVK